MKNHILEILKKYKAQFPNDQDLDKFFDYLSKNDNVIDRKNMNGHITVSALVVKDKKALLLWHKTFQSLMQPGGHIDPPDKTVFEAAIREVKEETGLDVEKDHIFADGIFSGIPISLDVHPILANEKKQESAHYHYDMYFYLKLKNEDQEIKNEDDGVEGAQWFDLEKIDESFNGVTFKAVRKYKSLSL